MTPEKRKDIKMNDYVIFTDSACDISAKLLDEWHVRYVNLTFRNDATGEEYTPDVMGTEDFYKQMREGTVFKTSAANMSAFTEAFEPVLLEGKDILYIGFSSGLSSTVNAADAVAKDMRFKYPERKIIAIDTLCASAGQGLILYLSVLKRNEGADIHENANYVLDCIPHLDHWFTVDDLVYLKRGGRVSGVAAFIGGMLDIKPVLHVDDDGHLIAMFKVRSRKKSIQALADKYSELIDDPAGRYFISHGDCIEDAKALEDLIYAKSGRKAELITDIGPVIGAHSGPGTLALFFLGKNR